MCAELTTEHVLCLILDEVIRLLCSGSLQRESTIQRHHLIKRNVCLLLTTATSACAPAPADVAPATPAKVAPALPARLAPAPPTKVVRAPPGQVIATPRAKAAPPQPTFVLVDADAWFYQAPNVKAPRLTGSLNPRTGDAFNDAADALRFEWRADHGDWLEIRPVRWHPLHCVGAPKPMLRFGLNLFVKRTALLPVLKTTLHQTETTGEHISALAGYWLQRGQAEIVHTRKGRPDVRIPVPSSAVSDRYQGTPRPPHKRWGYQVEADIIVGQEYRTSEDVTDVIIVPEDIGKLDEAMITIRTRCVEVTRAIGRPAKRHRGYPVRDGWTQREGGSDRSRQVGNRC